MGIWREWQPRYAQVGIATFPVRLGTEKKPAVRGWLRIGLRASAGLAAREQFAAYDAFGFVPARGRITVLDVDSTDELILRAALSQHGETPVLIRTASGKYHAWYRHGGERRMIRPWGPDLPIDVLGDGGYVVAPPSKSSSGNYEIIQGSLDDVDHLPIMRGLAGLIDTTDRVAKYRSKQPVTEGKRNTALFRRCLKSARYCDDRDQLLDFGRTQNESFIPPLPEVEVVQIVNSAWGYEERGENRSGCHGAWFDTAEANRLITSDQDVFVLLAYLRANNGPERTFMIANGLAERFGWGRRRLAGARKCLAQTYVHQIRKAARNRPALFVWKEKGGQN